MPGMFRGLDVTMRGVTWTGSFAHEGALLQNASCANTSGAGAASIACLDVMVGLGVSTTNIFVCDSKGVIYEGRPGGYDESKARYAQKTDARTLADVVNGADVFLGCSAPGVLTVDMIKS